MKITSRPEQSFQIGLMQWLAMVLPKDAVCFAIPNSAKRGIVEGAMMKRMGTLAGVPDIQIVHEGRALFLECKAPKGAVSPAQRETFQRLREAGAMIEVVRTIEEAQKALQYFGVPLRMK